MIKAQLKSGKIITGKLAETFLKKGLATEVSEETGETKPKGRPRKPKQN